MVYIIAGLVLVALAGAGYYLYREGKLPLGGSSQGSTVENQETGSQSSSEAETEEAGGEEQGGGMEEES